MVKMKKRRFVLLIISVIMGTLLAAMACAYAFLNTSEIAVIRKTDYDLLQDMGKKYSKLYTMQKTLNKESLWKIDEKAQMEGIYNGLLNSLGDKYSNYFTKKQYKELQDYISGTFTGVGIMFYVDKSGRTMISNVVSGSPADLAGMQSGDQIIKVDGEIYDDQDKLAAALRGKEGSKVSMTYKRDGKTETVTMIRAVVEDISVVSSRLKGNLGYIAIKAFEKGTAQQFAAELAKLESKNVKGIIIDLRNNGGGFLDEGIEVADQLLPEGTITYTKDRNGKKKYYNSDQNSTKVNYVVLVNQNTASSSEIVAAAIKDNKGGKIVGTQTYGKGIIQGVLPFEDGSAIRLTISQYFSPKGKKIHGIGVTPDYKVKGEAGQQTQLEKAMKLLS